MTPQRNVSPHAHTLSIMPTFRCTAACTNCGTLSHPREGTFLEPSLVISAIDQAAESGYLLVVFTGGEATLVGEQLFDYIAHAKNKGLLTRLVSNAHWAASERDTVAYVQRLQSAGLDELNASTGEQHVRFVPVRHVIEAACAAIMCGLTTSVMVELVEPRTITRAVIEDDARLKSILQAYPCTAFHIVESPWMPLSATRRGSYPPGQLLDGSNVRRRRGCDSVLSTTTIEANGTINACCGIGLRGIPELRIGHIGSDSLAEADRRAANDFLKRWIRLEGPERVLAWVAERDPTVEWENMYSHQCQACKRLYSDPKIRDVILKHHQEKLVDVLLGEVLLHASNLGTDNLFA